MVVTTPFCIICVKGASPSAVSCVTSLGNPCNQKLTQLPICFREGNGTPLQDSRLENPIDGGTWWAAVHGVAKSRTGLSDFTFTFHFHASEKEMATHSSVLAWRIPGTGEPGGLPSTGSHRVGHDWSDLPYLTLQSLEFKCLQLSYFVEGREFKCLSFTDHMLCAKYSTDRHIFSFHFCRYMRSGQDPEAQRG